MAIEKIGGIPPSHSVGPAADEIIAAKKLRAPLGELIQSLHGLTPDQARSDSYLTNVRDQLLALDAAAKKAQEL